MLVCRVPISCRCCSSFVQSNVCLSALAAILLGVASTVQFPMIFCHLPEFPSDSRSGPFSVAPQSGQFGNSLFPRSLLLHVQESWLSAYILSSAKDRKRGNLCNIPRKP